MYIATETPICIILIKINIHIFAAETVTCICAAEISNCIIATETVTCIIVTERSISIPLTETVSCIVPTETATCRIDYRNFHLQKWCQSEILLVTIKKLRKKVSTNFIANSFSTPCIT